MHSMNSVVEISRKEKTKQTNKELYIGNYEYKRAEVEVFKKEQ